MSTPAALVQHPPHLAAQETTFGGHPRGLRTLFFTEMWERFSYYGMRALLVLYMTASVADGGLGMSVVNAAAIYGWYTSLVYLSALPGGFLADRVLGQRLAVLLGGIVIAAGHFCLALDSLPLFYGGLALIICGTGLLKPNISTMVGGLYGEKDVRRDAGFSIFYMGINIGGMIAPLACGYLAQDRSFLGFLERHGINPHLGWHFGFAAAGLGMTLGLVQFVLGRRFFGDVGNAPRERSVTQQREAHEPLSRRDLTRLAAIGILFCFSALFWSAFEQAGSSLNLFADRITDNTIFGRPFPSSYYQAINSLFIIALAPVFAWLWVRLKDREPSSPAKFAWGLAFMGTGFLVVAFGAVVYQRSGQHVSPIYLILIYLFSTLGELSLSPVGLSTVTKLAPARLASLMMGVWFFSLSIGNKVGGWVAGHFDPNGSLPKLFLTVALFQLGAALVLAILTLPIKKLMAGVQ
jgi:POT family proton-dependent oligopeptide transporter